MSPTVYYRFIADIEMIVIPLTARERRMTPICMYVTIIHSGLGLIESITELGAGNRLTHTYIILYIIIKLCEVFLLYACKKLDKISKFSCRFFCAAAVRPIDDSS